MANPKLRIKEESHPEPLVSLTRVVMREIPGKGLAVVRQHFEAMLTGESVILEPTTREWASIQMEEEYEKEIAARRESEGW